MHFHEDIVAACAVLFNRQSQEVLMGLRGPKQSHPSTWCNPGGKTEGDEWAVETVARELKEEMGVRLPDECAPFTSMVHRIPSSSPVRGCIAVLYYEVPRDIPHKVDEVEIVAAHWFKLDYILEPTALGMYRFQPGSSIQAAHLGAMLKWGLAW